MDLVRREADNYEKAREAYKLQNDNCNVARE